MRASGPAACSPATCSPTVLGAAACDGPEDDGRVGPRRCGPTLSRRHGPGDPARLHERLGYFQRVVRTKPAMMSEKPTARFHWRSAGIGSPSPLLVR